VLGCSTNWRAHAHRIVGRVCGDARGKSVEVPLEAGWRAGHQQAGVAVSVICERVRSASRGEEEFTRSRGLDLVIHLHQELAVQYVEALRVGRVNVERRAGRSGLDENLDESEVARALLAAQMDKDGRPEALRHELLLERVFLE
jgi:hypothetical protein